MALANPTDIIEVRNGFSVEFGGDVLTDQTSTYTGADDHFRILVYEQETGGGESLEFTSDQYSSGPQSITIDEASSPGAFEVSLEEGKFYRAVVVAYDSGETVAYEEDEYFLYMRSGTIYTTASLVTTSGAAVSSAVDQVTLDLLLHALGHNAIAGQFNNESGYTAQRVVRGYPDTLTEAAALVASETEDASFQEPYVNPGDTDVETKFVTNFTTTDDGRESSWTTQEQEVV
jgi:hypothetical protein